MSDGFLKGKPKGGPDCDCNQCVHDKKLKFNAGTIGEIPLNAAYMILCDICGNKRCPRASNHRLECTHSNKSGQKGSIYEF